MIVDKLQKNKRLIKKSVAAFLLGVSVRTIERLISAGELEAYRVGNQVFLEVNNIEEYLQKNKIKPKT